MMARPGLRYGALGAPLAFAALPLYVVLPAHYATEFGVPLAAMGALLLLARAADALVDPWLGRLADRWLARSRRLASRAAWAAAAPFALGFAALFLPPVRGEHALLVWCALALTLTYFGYSLLGVLHQAWGARLGGDATMRARVVGWREAASLAGVLGASLLATTAGMPATIVVMTTLLVAALLALEGAPFAPGTPSRDAPPASSQQGSSGSTAAAGEPAGSMSAGASGAPSTAHALTHTAAPHPGASGATPWSNPTFRRLLMPYLLNGIASAIPATLVLFFVRDRLQAPSHEPWFLALYFAAGALSMPVWVRLVRRLGLVRAWLAGMALAVASFVWAATLGSGDVLPFALVCAASGLALGADLTVPPALLAGAIQRAGHATRDEGAYFGWWNAATKLNLALAAGLALPALQFLGYQPGATDAQGLHALTLAYCALPCVLKLLAAANLAWMHRRGHLE